MLSSKEETTHDVKLFTPRFEGTVLYDEPKGDKFQLLDARGWTYEMRYDDSVKVNDTVVHQYRIYLLNKRVTQRVVLLERLDYCLHEHWGLLADPHYNYECAIARLNPGTVKTLAVRAELTHLLMTRHAKREDLVLTTYNKLLETFGWATNTLFSVCETTGVLVAELLN